MNDPRSKTGSLEALLRQAGVAWFRADGDRVTDRGGALVELLGAQALKAATLPDLFGAARWATVEAWLREANGGGAAEAMSLALEDGGHPPVELSLLAEDQVLNGVLWNLSTVKEREQDRIRSERNQALNQLAAGMAEDLQDCIQTVLHTVEDMAVMPGLPAAATDHLDRIRAAALRGGERVRAVGGLDAIEPMASGEHRPHGPRSSDKLGMPRTLVVTEQADLGAVLEDTLSAEGWQALALSSGHDAVASLKAEHFDLLVVDLGLPDLPAWDVASTCKAIDPETTVLLIAGWASPVPAAKLQAHGIDLVLSKPFRRDDLLTLTRQLPWSPPPS
jgi:CheY-like chemotaxis protein